MKYKGKKYARPFVWSPLEQYYKINRIFREGAEIDLIPMTLSNFEIDLVAEAEHAKNQIYTILKVPKHLITKQAL